MSDLTATNPATCRRCGACCEQGGPALHLEDRELLRDGGLSLTDLVTVRTGEPAHDPRLGRATPVAQEFLKLSGSRGGWCCRFFDRANPGCGIYHHRPVECRLLFCRETGPLEAIMGRNLLSRRQLLDPDDPVRDFLTRQELEIPYAGILDLLAGLDLPESNQASLASLTGLVRTDLALRQHFLRQFPTRERQELFLLGRPLFLVLAPYGVRINEGRAGVSLHFGRLNK